jgi:hypothetical protein
MTAFKRCGVHLLKLGELENYLPAYIGNPYLISDADKQKVFELERSFLLDSDTQRVMLEERYASLISSLDEVSQCLTVNLDQHLNSVLGDWIHLVQSAVRRGEINSPESLTKHAQVDWAVHNRIIEVCSFTSNGSSFTCRIQLKPLIDRFERSVTFTNETVAASFAISLPAQHA